MESRVVLIAWPTEISTGNKAIQKIKVCHWLTDDDVALYAAIK